MAATRPARPGEAAGLTALCLRSKAHWGYDAEFMQLCVPSLTVEEQSIAEGRVLVAIDGTGRTAGTVSVGRDGDDAELALMFVEPAAMGGGTGRQLFEAAVALARELGYRRMTILADVNAAPFYERMGARFLRNEPSDAIPGRVLPFYEYDLTSGASS
ncbi:GNAT family N-acetyltransferase [uncultured Reyranella sp.]|uniref:GNAT family N-acetyltransferase n=1 Tax=uncultured Reyranella sp. TaxID=735512 RepID=UPI0025F6FFBB|nr:GNAT family N-acetyltransferase [uncultured Reyranella sp.]